MKILLLNHPITSLTNYTKKLYTAMEPTVANKDFMFNGPPSLVKPFIAKVISKLQEPNVSDQFAHDYFSTAVDAGDGPSRRRDTAGYLALDCIQFLVMPATMRQRRQIFQQLMQSNVLEICTDKLDNHPLLIHRNAAANTLRVVAANLFLGEALSPQQTADLLERCCRWTLAGPDRDSDELLDDNKVWQTQVMVGRPMPTYAAHKYGKRWFGMTAEHFMFTAHALVCRVPQPSRKFTLEVLQHKPAIIDLLLECALEARPPWFPESQVDELAMETLALLLQFPHAMVPGLDIPLEGKAKDEYQVDFDASVKIMEIFVSRPGWAQKLVDIWSKLEREKPVDIQRMLDRVSSDWYAAAPPNDETLIHSMEYRGQVRIATLRLIASATYVDSIRDVDLLSVLRIAYLGTQKSKSREEVVRSHDPFEVATWVEHNEEVLRVPLWAADAGDDFDEVATLPREATMGPIALVRLLIRLTERGLVDQSQSWTTLPEGTVPSIMLKQVQQILSPVVVKKILSTALKRVSAYREIGHERVQEGHDHRALLAYTPASELALSLLELNRVADRKYAAQTRGAQKELVLCLGNAATVCRRKKRYEGALLLAAAAERYGQHASAEEGITTDMKEKNKKRLAELKRIVNM
ncbi:unnamed protein product [Somion occarium]|uniref:Uncharacterized protein n=1 Tax=Somion occarium TaxID=3059160 RepID=A0ABP1CW22_9APHY